MPFHTLKQALKLKKRLHNRHLAVRRYKESLLKKKQLFKIEIEIGIDKAQKTQQKTTEIASMIEEPFRVITMNRKTSHHDE